MENKFRKLAIANYAIFGSMFIMIIIGEIIRPKTMFGVITGVYWIILDLAVLVVALVTAIKLWRAEKIK
jgi:hypothetical protein